MRDECRGDRKTWRWKHSGVSVKTFSVHVVVVLRPVVSGKRFITHGRVWGNRKSETTEVTDESEGAAELQGPRLGVIVQCPLCNVKKKVSIYDITLKS